MQAGNVNYRRATDLPSTVPVFPLAAALLLPGGRMPLNIFEPRYLLMIDEAMAGPRVVGLIQPGLDGALRDDGEPDICSVGCIGRITSLAETGDGVFGGADWLFEIKYDGYRMLAERDEDQVHLRYRRGSEAAPLYPEIVLAMAGRDTIDRWYELETTCAMLPPMPWAGQEQRSLSPAPKDAC